jgi:hypothetical protein
LTPDSIQQKYAQTVASSWITPGCVQFLADKKRFHTAWSKSGQILQRSEMTRCAINVIRWTAEKQRAFSSSPTNHPMALDAGSGRRPPH